MEINNWGIIGHEDVVNFFERTIREGSLAHSFLITGIKDVGKKELVLAFAKRLLCTSVNAPCNSCNTCRKIYDLSELIEINRFKHPDVFYTSNETDTDETGTSVKTKSSISIDQIRQMQNNVLTAPFEGSARIFIIDHAEKMTVGASNALLKLLEEPPSYVYIFLLTDSPGEILETVISRCTKIDLLPVPRDTIRDYLVSQKNISLQKAELVASLANGAPIKALNCIVDDTWWENRNKVIDELLSVISLSKALRFDYAANFKGSSADLRNSTSELIETWMILWRDLLLCGVGLEQNVINTDYIAKLKEISCKMNIDGIRNYLFELKNAITKLKANANIQLVMEVLMLDMPEMS